MDEAKANVIGEGSFSIFKCGMKERLSTVPQAAFAPLPAEIDFRDSNRAKLGIDNKART
ncbi:MULTISPECIES: hypothetical protein [unclassified Sphingomonas]|uniref:hypothetical protein n=1 Tax=unclassified Sphingomonas TaxID=196159 RepID=UPI000A76E9E6